MKIQLPHREVTLDTNPKTMKSPEDRKLEVENILQEVIEFHSEKMTVEEYLTYTWKKKSTATIMDLIGYYLSKENPTEEQSNDTNYYGHKIKEDRFIISESESKAMRKGSKKYKSVGDMAYELGHN